MEVFRDRGSEGGGGAKARVPPVGCWGRRTTMHSPELAGEGGAWTTAPATVRRGASARAGAGASQRARPRQPGRGWKEECCGILGLLRGSLYIPSEPLPALPQDPHPRTGWGGTLGISAGHPPGGAFRLNVTCRTTRPTPSNAAGVPAGCCLPDQGVAYAAGGQTPTGGLPANSFFPSYLLSCPLKGSWNAMDFCLGKCKKRAK